MIRLDLPVFGDATSDDAAHIMNARHEVVAYVPEPEARAERSTSEDEFRQAVRKAFREAASDNVGETFTIQFDPGRDRASSETITI